MRHWRSLIAKMVVLVLVAVVGTVVVTGLNAAAGRVKDSSDAPAVCGTDGGRGSEATVSTMSTMAGSASAVRVDDGEGSVDPKAACRRAPECATDADCDPICGVGLGKCVHSNCPVRVCHCH